MSLSIQREKNMNDNEQKPVVPEGDSRVNSITSLCEIKHLASCMANSIKSLHIYVNININHQIH